MRTRSNWVAVLLISAMILSGCTTGGGSADRSAGGGCDAPALTPPERQICQDKEHYDSTVVEGTALGAAGGAILGCGLGYLLNGAKGCIGGAVAGGVAGGVFGNRDATATAQQTQQANAQIRQLDQITQELRQKNTELQSSIIAAQSVVSNGRQQLKQIADEERQHQISLQQAQAERAQVTRDRDNLRGIVKDLGANRADFQKKAAQSGQTSPDFDNQMHLLDQQIATLKKQSDDLTGAMS